MNLDWVRVAISLGVRFLCLKSGSFALTTSSWITSLGKAGVADGQHHRGGDEGHPRHIRLSSHWGCPKICPGWLQGPEDSEP